MTMIMVFSCVLISFGPHAVYYYATPLYKYEMLGTSIKAAGIYFMTVFLTYFCMAIFLNDFENASFDVFQEILRAVIGFLDIAGLYLALTLLRHKRRHMYRNLEFQAVGLGWSFADCVLCRLAPLKEVYAWTRDPIQFYIGSLEANSNLFLRIWLATLVSMIWLRKKKKHGPLRQICFFSVVTVAAMPSVKRYLMLGCRWNVEEVITFELCTAMIMAIMSPFIWLTFCAC